MSTLVRHLLEPLTKRVLTLLELLDVRLQVVTHTFDTRQRPLAGERGLRPITVLGVQLLFVRLFGPIDGALGIEQNVVRDADVLVEGCALLPLEEMSERVRRAGV